MALTRRMLTAMGLTEEQVQTVIQAHTQTVDALKGYKEDAEKLADIQRELDELKADDGGYRAKYEDEHAAFEAYRADAEAKASAAEKAALYRAALRAAGVDERRHDVILRVTDMSKVSVKDGALKDERGVMEAIRRDWADFIPTTTTTGTKVENPPANAGAAPTKESILSIRDAGERQRAMAENRALFGF